MAPLTPAFASSFTPLRALRSLSTRRATTPLTPRMSLVVLAPGQGAQAPGMLSAWTSASPAAAALVAAADEQLAGRLGAPLSELAAEGADASVLARTDVAQPAIFVTSMAAWAGMQELGLASPGDVAATAGLSLGEYTALAISGALSFSDGLELVTLRGRAMQDAAEASSGGMVALIGADNAAAAAVVDACREADVLVAANFNAPGQVVLSGSMAAVDRAAAHAQAELGLRVAKLDVAGAFHSPLMAPAAERLRDALAGVDVGEGRCQVYSNVTARPHEVGSVRERLVDQLTSPVLWAKCVGGLKEDEKLAAAEFVELAPGRTLGGIMRKIDRKVKVTNYAAPPATAST